MASIIKVEHLSYVYNPGMPNAVTALDDVSFEVEEGDFVGIIGATGSGKSTLITHMNGLNKPTSGKIIIDGRDLWAEPEKIRDFRFLTGLVFQYPEYQLFEETCYKDIAFGPKNMGLDEAEVDKRVHEAAEFVGLDEALLERSPFELSGGQKRRVAVAGVMAMKPRILVLDEPAAGLDPEGRDEILSEVKDYHKKTGTTVLLVSHSMEDIAKYADKVLVMSRKKIAMYDTVEKVFARAPELLELGLSVPQVTKIFLKLREMGVDVPADVYTIPYAVKMILAAKARRDAGETLVLPRNEEQKGGAAVQGGGLIQRLRDGIHKALHHEEAGTGTRREADDQCQRDAVALGHAQRLQDEVDGDHGHEAREQVQDHRHVHVRLAHLPLQAAGAVRHTQHEEGGDDAGAAGDEEGVHEHPGEVHDVKLREQRLVVVHGVGLGQEGRDELALAVTEGLHHQPEERDQPDDAQHDQEDIRNNIARHALGVHSAAFDFVRHYLNPSSSLYEPLER